MQSGGFDDPRFEGVTFKVIDQTMDAQVKDFMWQHYYPDEPISRSLNIKRNAFLDENHLQDALNDRSSLAAVDRSGRVLAVRLGKVVHIGDWFAKWGEYMFYFAVMLCSCCCMKASTKHKFEVIFKFSELLEFDIWSFFDKYRCRSIYDDRGLCSSRGHGIKGLGAELLRRSEQLGKQRGCTLACAITTGKYSKIAFERQGWTLLKTLQYRDFTDSRGQLYLRDTREHTEAAVFLKRL